MSAIGVGQHVVIDLMDEHGKTLHVGELAPGESWSGRFKNGPLLVYGFGLYRMTATEVEEYVELRRGETSEAVGRG